MKKVYFIGIPLLLIFSLGFNVYLGLTREQAYTLADLTGIDSEQVVAIEVKTACPEMKKSVTDAQVIASFLKHCDQTYYHSHTYDPDDYIGGPTTVTATMADGTTNVFYLLDGHIGIAWCGLVKVYCGTNRSVLLDMIGWEIAQSNQPAAE